MIIEKLLWKYFLVYSTLESKILNIENNRKSPQGLNYKMCGKSMDLTEKLKIDIYFKTKSEEYYIMYIKCVSDKDFNLFLRKYKINKMYEKTSG